MIFTSFEYLLCFLPIAVCITYFCARVKHASAKIWVVFSSLFFYAFWKISYLPILVVSILFNYFCGRIVARSAHKKICLALSVAVNLAILGYYKYTNFAVHIINSITGADFHLEKIVLPLAISFFTFQQIAWLIDQYRNDAPKSTFLEYVCAVAFFPHLIAGPIVQYHDLIPQFQCAKSFRPHWDSIAKGFFLIACGVFKKIIIADTLAVYVSFAFDETVTLNLLQAWLAVFSYTMQIYFDFSGYCDIAIGSSHLLGIRLPDNFHSPYKSSSVREFWQRWHMTLGDFLTHYLYIPLGGRGGGLARTCINVLLVMFLSGLWHGAAFGFILWGTLHGIAMVIQRLWNAAGRTCPKAFATIFTFLFVAFAWVLFRATDLAAAVKVYKGMFGLGKATLPHAFQGSLPTSWDMLLPTADVFGLEMTVMRPVLWALLAAFICVYTCPRAGQVWETLILRKSRLTYAASFGAAILILLSFAKMVAVPYTEFIYFNF
ncbi:MAG: MBOAT family protein [Bacteroidales bacterium]|jgi:D-alanyl-lipoteichoic acid acyltransferase DltB (MBOAT superfamily)|nr:MBOAT family protein [Bacteroidales bacterium]